MGPVTVADIVLEMLFSNTGHRRHGSLLVAPAGQEPIDLAKDVAALRAGSFELPCD